MNRQNLFLIILAFSLFIIGIIVVIITSIRQSPTEPVIGEKTNNLTGFLSKKELSDGREEFTYTSSLISRENTVIADETDTITFKRTVFLAPDKTLKYFSTYDQELGKAEREIMGSVYYGPFIVTKIYASKGITLIGNSETGEVYEMHEYTPTSVESYINLYGQDINENVAPHEE